jgi:acyl-CoA thioester hydrolase
MISFSKQISIRWSDIDPNFHVRHSVYYDLGAQQRIEILEQAGLGLKVMQEQSFGPIIFREECVFKKEIKLSDEITINVRMAGMKPDASRWTIQHQFLNAENKLCALLTLDGAWLDTKLRKLVSPTPQIIIDVFKLFPKSDSFVEM